MRFAGDCLLAGHYQDAAGEDPALAFRDFDLLREADIAMVNLESPITTRGTPSEKAYIFRARPGTAAVLRDAGIDIVTLANNHIYDYGPDGLFDTITMLDAAGVAHVGAGRTHDEAHRPVVIDVRGRRIGFLGYYQGGEAPSASDTSAGVAERRLELIQRDIALLRQDAVSFVVIAFHWGVEKATVPEVWQTAFAHAVIDAGADAVIGHHPHVLQGIERYGSGVIAYSLGNFIFGGNSRHSYDTGVLEIRIGPDGPTATFIPVRVTSWTARVLSGAGADSLRRHMASLSEGFPTTIFNRKESE